MNIENRSDGNYIVTGEVTDKGESIVIKLDSEVDNQLITYRTQDSSTSINLSWLLNHSDELGLYVELLATNRLKTNREISQIDDEVCVAELVSMVKNNGTLEDCTSIQKAIYESYNKLFDTYLENEKILHSSIIVDGVVEVKHNNKILGHGTRFIINDNKIIICEYTGKTIPLNVLPQINIYKNNTQITCESKEFLDNVINAATDNTFNENNSIGYLAYTIDNEHEFHYSFKTMEFPKLNTPYHYSDKQSMIQYVKNNNTIDDIIKYKIALKGKVEILNIDEYMVNEFLI